MRVPGFTGRCIASLGARLGSREGSHTSLGARRSAHRVDRSSPREFAKKDAIFPQ